MKNLTLTLVGIVAVVAVLAVGVVYVQSADDGSEPTVPVDPVDPVMDEVVNEQLNIRGLTDGVVTSFKGIPYAEAPVGDLKFAPPVPKAPWTETLDCTKFGDSAVQFIGSNVGDMSEDCLYLNVWMPAGASPGDDLPVYVWIHGGAWAIGSGSKANTDGSTFAREGIVTVTINYRLGVQGYLSLDVLDEQYGSSGNFGMMDQIAALRWVNENISSFGGDTDNITVGGESAGSGSVFNLLLCKQADGLFQKAIMESGTIVNCFTPMLNGDPANARAIGKEMMESLGLEDNMAGLEELRQMDPFMLWNLYSLPLLSVIIDKPYAFGPVYDGILLPEDPLKAIEEGDYNTDVKVIIGNNGREGDLFSGNMRTVYDIPKFLYRTWGGDDARAVMDYYKDDTRPADEIYKEIVAMTLFQIPVNTAQNLLSAGGTTVYAYEFEYASSNGIPPIHGSEISYAFDTLETMIESPTDTDRDVAKNMHAMWANFIRNGDPNEGDGITWDVEWNPYDEDGNVMHFTAEPFMAPKTLIDTIESLTPYFNTID